MRSPRPVVSSLPAAPGVFPLEVRSWVHTTLPQVFRAAAVVITGNARSAAPLGVSTLMAFLEPHICCHRQPSRRLLRHPAAPAGVTPGAVEEVTRNGVVAMGPALIDGTRLRHGADGLERDFIARTAARAETEMEAAAAAGEATAAEYGSTGEELVSRMALESVGLLVEGLAGQQVWLLAEEKRANRRVPH